MERVDASYLPTLDGWRAVAISMVLFSHARIPNSTAAAIAPYGAYGVHLFFAISGFLITSRLLQERRATGGIALGSFYTRRVFRILPAAISYLAVVSIAGFGLRWIPIGGMQVVSSLAFFRNYYVEDARTSWYTGHFWSLSVEEHFYLLWPAVLVFLVVGRAWVAPALACAFAAWRLLDQRFEWIAHLQPSLQGVVGRTDYRMDGLLWGCALAIWMTSRRNSLPAKEINLAAHAPTDLVGIFAGSPIRTRWMALAGFLLAAATVTACIVWRPVGFEAPLALATAALPAMTVAAPDLAIGKLLELSWIRWIGRISYSLYIWQELFLVVHGLPAPLGLVQKFPINLCCAFACGIASYYCIERPMIRWGRRVVHARNETTRHQIPAIQIAASPANPGNPVG